MTVRTEAALTALYADNTTGQISAEDLRDLVDTLFQDRTEHVHGHQFSATSGGGRPTTAQYGPTPVLEFAVADEAWFHFTLPERIDITQDVVLQVDWAPSGAETGKTVSWDLDYLALGTGGELINTATATLQVVDAAVATTQYEDSRATFTIPAAALAAGDHELKVRLERVVSSAGPVSPPAVHHVYAEVAVKWVGAS